MTFFGRHIPVMATVALVLAVRVIDVHLAAGDTPAPEAAANPAVKLPPEAEKKLKAAVEKLTDAARKHVDKLVKEDMADLTKMVGLTPAQTASFQPFAAQAKDKIIKDFVTQIDTSWREFYENSPEQFDSSMTSFASASLDLSSGMGWGSDISRPSEQEAWQKGLDQTLTGEQKTVWKNTAATRAPALDAEAEKFLSAQEDRLRDQAKTMIRGIAGNVTQSLSLSKERKDVLDALAEEAAKKSAAAQRKEIAAQLTHMDAKQRESMLKQRNMYYTIQAKNAPDQQPVWTEGVAKLLTDDERATLKNVAGEHRRRRVRAYGGLLLTLFDEKVALTAAQRERLLPLAEKAVERSSALMAERAAQTYYSTSLKTFYLVAGEMPQEEVKAILDPAQWEHWHALHEAALHPSADDDDDGRIFFNRPAAKPTPSPSPRPLPEPEEVECAISDFLADKTVKQRKSVQARLLLEAEDFARVAALPPAPAETLRLAALGAAEEEMQAYNANTENVVRSQVNGAKPENIRQKLSGIQSYYFTSRRSVTPVDKLKVWAHAVTKEGTEEQRAAWEKEKNLRADARSEAIAQVITAQFDREVTINQSQWKTIQEKTTAIVKEYKTEMDNYFSYSNGTPWYLQTYSMFIPMAGIPEEEMKSLLDKGQMDRWTASYGFSNATSYWENITANHKRNNKALSQ